MSQTELITKRLDGKIAVIRGGTSGKGLVTAQRLEKSASINIHGE